MRLRTWEAYTLGLTAGAFWTTLAALAGLSWLRLAWFLAIVLSLVASVAWRRRRKRSLEVRDRLTAENVSGDRHGARRGRRPEAKHG